MAIQVSKKKKDSKLPKGLDFFFQITLFLFILTGAFYFFMLYLNAEAEGVKKDVEQYIGKKEAEIPEIERLEETIREYSYLIEDFKMIKGERKDVTSFLAFFEEATHPDVTVSQLEAIPMENMIRFSGEAETLVVIGQQFRSLCEEEIIFSALLDNLKVSPEKNTIEFSFSVNVSQELFNPNKK